MDVNKFLIGADKLCDYVPVLSTITNIVDIIITKVVFRKDADQRTENTYFNYLKSKNDKAGLRALIPFAAAYICRDSKASPTIDKVKNAAVETGIINVDAPKEMTYEAKVDEFLNKLIELNPHLKNDLHFDKEMLKNSVLEENALMIDSWDLTVLPTEIGNLTSLTVLSLGKNHLTALPHEIGKLTSLTELSLSGNRLTALPGEIGKLTSLTRLGLYNNALTALPREIGNLISLTELYLGVNRLTALPSEIGNLLNLLELTLSDNELTTIPKEIGNLAQLTILDLHFNPVIAAGDESGWGRRELRAHFHDRVYLPNPNVQKMSAKTTFEQVYQNLDNQPIHINREKFKEAKMAEIPGTTIENGEQFLEIFNAVVSKLNFDDANKPGYLSYELLASDFANNEQGSNWEKVNKHLMPRLLGYFKTLYDLPLEPDEAAGWQMYEDKKLALKMALNYIMETFNTVEDVDQLASLFLMLVNGLLHCPTGQKEGVDTVVLALLENKTERSSDLAEMVKGEFAKKKNAFFKVAILTKGAENSQNVHLISNYEGLLREKLGLSNILDYKEKMGVFGDDPFNKNPANALKVFYDLVTPNRLVNWLLEKIPSTEDLKLFKELEELQKRQVSASSNAPNEMLQNLEKRLQGLEEKQGDQTEIAAVKRMIEQQRPKQSVVLTEEERNQLKLKISTLKDKIKKIEQFKPISLDLLITYLHDNDNTDDWWKKYFATDPTEDSTVTLTRDGALELLTQLSFLTRKS